MTFQRVMLMATLLTPVLGGCAANLDLGMLYAAPGKYDYLRCEDLPARLAASIARVVTSVERTTRIPTPGMPVLATPIRNAHTAPTVHCQG